MCPQRVVLHCWAYNFAKLLLDWLMFPECHLYLQNHLSNTDAYCIAGSLRWRNWGGLRALCGKIAANQREQQDRRTEEHNAAASISLAGGGLDSKQLGQCKKPTPWSQMEITTSADCVWNATLVGLHWCRIASLVVCVLIQFCGCTSRSLYETAGILGCYAAANRNSWLLLVTTDVLKESM